MTSSSDLLKSTDGGITWTIQLSNYSNGITELDFLNTNSGCAVGFAGLIITTQNGGAAWIDQTTRLNLVLNKVDFPSLGMGYTIGRMGSGYTATSFVLKSADSGENWEVSDSLANSWFLDLHFINEQKGWVVGVNFEDTSGFIIHTQDGGYSWTIQYSYPNNGFTSIYFTDELNGWASLYSGANLLHTTNGGISWNLKPTGHTYQPEEIFFIYSAIGWVIGHTSSPLTAKIIKTTDSGFTWQDVSPQNTYDWLYDIDFISEQTGWIVGEHGKVFEASDGGTNWIRIWQDNYPAFETVDFVNENVGWIVTTELLISETALFYTTNGGETWELQAKLPGTKGSMFMLNQNTGWYAGGHSVYGDPQVAFIYKTTNGGVSFVEENLIEVSAPSEFLLSQNYPNPFNPYTKIKYSIPSVGTQHAVSVQIKVYGTLGNEIETLVNEEKLTGTYEITWHVVNLPSGVYFYQLRVENYIETKKMILLK